MQYIGIKRRYNTINHFIGFYEAFIPIFFVNEFSMDLCRQ